MPTPITSEVTSKKITHPFFGTYEIRQVRDSHQYVIHCAQTPSKTRSLRIPDDWFNSLDSAEQALLAAFAVLKDAIPVHKEIDYLSDKLGEIYARAEAELHFAS